MKENRCDHCGEAIMDTPVVNRKTGEVFCCDWCKEEQENALPKSWR